MLWLITYRRLTQGIFLFHRYLLLYHPSVLPSLHEFFLNVQNRKYTQALPHCIVHKFPFQRVFICSNRTPDKRVTSVLLRWWICPEISERAKLNVFSITPCTGLQTRWFLMRWNGNLMELLDISFSPFVHLGTSSQIDEDSGIHRGIWRGWLFIL
jgi:hypothetical protein